MPAFYSRHSGVKLDYQVNNSNQIAEIRKAGKKLNKLQRKSNFGFVVFNPIPEKFELDETHIEPLIQEAIKSKPENVTGKAVTPYLLSKIADISGNESVVSNIALVTNNV